MIFAAPSAAAYAFCNPIIWACQRCPHFLQLPQQPARTVSRESRFASRLPIVATICGSGLMGGACGHTAFHFQDEMFQAVRTNFTSIIGLLNKTADQLTWQVTIESWRTEAAGINIRRHSGQSSKVKVVASLRTRLKARLTSRLVQPGRRSTGHGLKPPGNLNPSL